MSDIKSFEELKLAKNSFYGPNGELAKLKLAIRTASIEEKREIGKQISQLTSEAEIRFKKIEENIKINIIKNRIKDETIDVSAPITTLSTLHPLTLVKNRLENWLISNGFYSIKSTEVETDEYNFQKLNIPVDHPSRDMQDSLYIDDNTLLRTHNTGVSARELEKNSNKEFKHYAIGNVFRNDEDDATHSHQFTQLDLIAAGDYSFSNLIAILKSMLSYVFEEDLEIRLRPSYFPFTEPSVEVDIFYNKKWIEILGAGMVHSKVMKNAGYTNHMNGIAAGLGIERIAMVKYGIINIRDFSINDLRFLNNFKGGK